MLLKNRHEQKKPIFARQKDSYNTPTVFRYSLSSAGLTNRW